MIPSDSDRDSRRHERKRARRVRERARRYREHRPRPRRGSGLVFGFILLIAGALFLLDNLNIVEVEGFFHWWPVVLIAIGLGEWVEGSSIGAAIWIGVGSWFLLYNFDYLRVSPFEVFWPALLTIIGLILVWQALTNEPGDRPRSMSAFALMSGNVQRSSAEPVDAIQATAVMGGCALDLRKIRTGERETVIDVFALWGGIEITIPEGWALELRVTPILAGVEDSTAPPAPDAPVVLIRGTIVMGGAEVKN